MGDTTMRGTFSKLMIAAVVAGSALFLTGCGPSADAAQRPASEPATPAVEEPPATADATPAGATDHNATPIQISVTKIVYENGSILIEGIVNDLVAPGAGQAVELIAVETSRPLSSSVAKAHPLFPDRYAVFSLTAPATGANGRFRAFVKVTAQGSGRSNRTLIDIPVTEPLAAPAGDPTVRIQVQDFDQAESRFGDNPGIYESNPVIATMGATNFHAYGRPSGKMVYKFTAQTIKPRAFIHARLSSEFPGYKGPDDGFTTVTLVLNGKELGEKQVIADNGTGQDYSWGVPEGALVAGQENKLEFLVKADQGKPNGICLYGKAAAPSFEDHTIEVRFQDNQQ